MQLHPRMLKWTSLQVIYSRPELSLILNPTLKAGEFCKPHVKEREWNLVRHLPTPFGTAKAQAINTSWLTLSDYYTEMASIFKAIYVAAFPCFQKELATLIPLTIKSFFSYMQSNIIYCMCVLCSSLMQSMCPNYKHWIPAGQPFTENLPWMAPYLLVCERQPEQTLQRKEVVGNIWGRTGDTTLCNVYGLKRNQSVIACYM